jgi:hypothetical protein
MAYSTRLGRPDFVNRLSAINHKFFRAILSCYTLLSKTKSASHATVHCRTTMHVVGGKRMHHLSSEKTYV